VHGAIKNSKLRNGELTNFQTIFAQENVFMLGKSVIESPKPALLAEKNSLSHHHYLHKYIALISAKEKQSVKH